MLNDHVVVRERLVVVLDQRVLVPLVEAVGLVDVAVHGDDLGVVFLSFSVSSPHGRLRNRVWLLFTM